MTLVHRRKACVFAFLCFSIGLGVVGAVLLIVALAVINFPIESLSLTKGMKPSMGLSLHLVVDLT